MKNIVSQFFEDRKIEIIPQFFTEQFKVCNMEFSLVGLHQKVGHECIIASSAHEDPMVATEIACFEFLERYAISKIFKEIKENSMFVKSRSNGVALQESSAINELLERHQVLCYWYQGLSPKIELLGSCPQMGYLYSLNFGKISINEKEIFVRGHYAKRCGEQYPPILSLGASETEALALGKSFRELIQRLGFLWDETIHDEIPVLREHQGPLFHQEYYLSKIGISKLNKWIFNNKNKVELNNQIDYINVNVHSLKSLGRNINEKLYVANSKECIPLYFGVYPYKNKFPVYSPIDVIHPIP